MEISLPDDLEEEFELIRQESGRRKARLWYRLQAARSLPFLIKNLSYWSLHMFKNYLKIALRNIKKQKGFSFIKISGLSMGMACCLLIFLWVQDEVRYNRFHENAGRLYRVYCETKYASGQKQTMSQSFSPLARLLKTRCPDVVESTRFAAQEGMKVKISEKSFTNDVFGFVDPPFFSMFTFPLIKGDPKRVFDNKFSAVITEGTSRKYFGNHDPIGQTLNIEDQYDLQVTGVIKDVPRHSSYQFDILVPFGLYWGPGWEDTDEAGNWGGNPLETHVLLQPSVRPETAEPRMTEALKSGLPSPLPAGMEIRLGLQPLTRVHLYNPEGGGLIKYITIFSIIAVFILVVACVNFVNLSTARSGRRAKEVGLRKVVGAYRSDLIKQFFGESVLIAGISLLFSFGLVYLLLPAFNKLADKQLRLEFAGNSGLIFGLIGIAVLTAALSGSYPALVLSSFQPVKVIRGTVKSGAKAAAFRKVLVVFQFTVSVFLIIATLVISSQLRFMRNKDLGFDRENVVCVRMTRPQMDRYDVLKAEMLSNPAVLSVTRSAQNIFYIGSNVSDADWEGKTSGEKINLNFEYVDFDYFETLQIAMAEGRTFSRNFATDPAEAYIVNETAVKLMGIKDPVGKRLSIFNNPGKIIGVVKDFHFLPLRFAIAPMVIGMNPEFGKTNLFARIAPGRIPATLKYLESICKKISPDHPFQYYLSSRTFRYLYGAEMRLGNIIGVFTFLGILISCLGLFGLASFMAELRTKEIGIRKVLGASRAKILGLLTTEFTKWVIAANIIAWPLAYFLMDKWLRGYAYRIHINILIFAASGLGALAMALLTVGYQALKAASINPAKTLKYE